MTDECPEKHCLHDSHAVGGPDESDLELEKLRRERDQARTNCTNLGLRLADSLAEVRRLKALSQDLNGKLDATHTLRCHRCQATVPGNETAHRAGFEAGWTHCRDAAAMAVAYALPVQSMGESPIVDARIAARDECEAAVRGLVFCEQDALEDLRPSTEGA